MPIGEYQMTKAQLVSPWKIWLPLEENAAVRVVICAYEEKWIPITFTTLAEAIGIYQNVCLQGEKFLCFPLILILGIRTPQTKRYSCPNSYFPFLFTRLGIANVDSTARFVATRANR